MNPLRSQALATPDKDVDAGLGEAIRRAAGARAEPVATHRTPNPYATVSESEVVSVELATGGRLAIFVKHLGEEQRDHPDKRVREREVRVYEELLADPGLPVPRFLGCARDEETGNLALFLEHVEGWNLKYQGLARWRASARHLARLHRALADPGERLLGRDFLLHLDHEYLLAWAGRAVASVSSLSAEPAARLRRTVDRMGPAIELLAGQPPTLVHNDLAPKNVIASTGAGAARTWIVDWEMAGAGCGLLDLAHLMHGLPAREARRMLEIYGRELAGSGLLPSGEEGERLLAACRLHCTLYRLAHADEWGLPLDQVAEWVAESEALNREAAR